jgi:hypothetical protein
MSVVIKTVDTANLSKVLKEAKVELSAKEARIIDHCHNLSYTTWVGYNNESLICAWGIIPPTVLSDEVYLWLHTTQAINTNQFLFVRHSQIFIEKLLRDYTAITGHVRIGARHSQRWLKWLGAEFGPIKGQMMTFRIERHG